MENKNFELRDCNDCLIGSYNEDQLIKWAQRYAIQKNDITTNIVSVEDAIKYIECADENGYQNFEVYFC